MPLAPSGWPSKICVQRFCALIMCNSTWFIMTIIFSSCRLFFLSSSFSSSPNLSHRRLDVCHTSTHRIERYRISPPTCDDLRERFYWILLLAGDDGHQHASGISWTIYKSFAPRSRQITTPVPHHSVFTGRMPFRPPSEQRKSTGGRLVYCIPEIIFIVNKL